MPFHIDLKLHFDFHLVISLRFATLSFLKLLIPCWYIEWLPTPVFLPGEFQGQRSPTGCGPRGCKELDMTEQLTHIVNLQYCVSFRCGYVIQLYMYPLFFRLFPHIDYHRILSIISVSYGGSLWVVLYIVVYIC